MSKLTLSNVGTLSNQASAAQTINDNFAAIEEAMETTLSRDGSLPNEMLADLDMNSNDILNVGTINASTYLQNGLPLSAGGGGGGGSVTSVNGKTGVVTLDASDVGADPVNTAIGLVAIHTAAADPHSQYTTEAEAAAAAPIQSIVAGPNVTISYADPKNPVISATGTGGGGEGFALTNFSNVVLDGSQVTANITTGGGATKGAENIVVTNSTTLGKYSVRYAELQHNGDVQGFSNDIGDTLICRYNNITLGNAWGRWDVIMSPLDPASSLPTKPASAQRFAIASRETNPTNRHKDTEIAYTTPTLYNWVGGEQMVPETQDFTGLLGNKRVGYNVAFGYLLSPSGYTCTENNKHARMIHGVLANPNTIYPRGAFLFATGHKDYVSSISLVNGGVGYTVGDQLTFNTGLDQAANSNTVVEVVTVNGSGTITSARLFYAGWYNQTFATTVGVTGGTGSGATFNYTTVNGAASSDIPRAWGGVAGTWDYGIDAAAWSRANSNVGAASFKGGMFRAPNNQNIIVARNATDSADVVGMKINTSDQWELGGTNPVKITGNVGFYNTAPVAKPTISGYLGSYAHTASIASALATLGLSTNNTTTVAPEIYNALHYAGVDPTGATSSSTGLQSAINGAAGGVLVIPEGSYKLTAELKVPSNTTIIAYGATFTCGADILSMLRNDANGSTGGYDANSNITIIGGKWYGKDTTFNMSVFAWGHATGITMRDVYVFNNNQYHHIEVNACQDVLIHNCKFEGGYNFAVSKAGTFNSTLNEAIQIDAAVSSGAFPWFGPYDSTPCKNVTIDGCVFTDVGNAMGTHSDNGLGPHARIRFQNCKVNAAYFAGVKSLSWSDINITNNRFENVYCGVLIQKSANRWANGIQISGNTFYGIGTKTASPPTAYAPGCAVYVKGGNTDTGNNPRNIRIVNNVVDGASGTYSKSGIVVEFVAPNLVINDNVVTGCREHGVYVYGGQLAVVSGNVSNQNNVAGLGSYDILIGNTGTVTETTRATVTGNSCSTIAIKWSQNSIVRNNNLYTSLDTANNASTVFVGDNLVGAIFS